VNFFIRRRGEKVRETTDSKKLFRRGKNQPKTRKETGTEEQDTD
jgi:hypothetical protein